MNVRNPKAFTLIELLVVVLIIGILSAIALPQYEKAVEKARAAEAIQNLSSVQRAIDMWFLANGKPSETINFIGNYTANGNASKGDLDIDLESSLDCNNKMDGSCASKNFLYLAYCNPAGFCENLALKRKGNDDVYYFFNFYSDFNNAVFEKHCSDNDTDIGIAICKNLNKDGWIWEQGNGW